MAVTHGDLQKVQNRILSFQGHRETQMAIQGHMRWSQFKAPVETYAPIEMYGPWDDDGHNTANVFCPFSVAYSDEPIMAATLSIADGEEWDGETFPALAVSVVNWRRVAGAQLFIGAEVAFSIEEAANGQKFIMNFAFYGPAVTTPVGDIAEFENSTTGPMWEMAEWLQG